MRTLVLNLLVSVKYYGGLLGKLLFQSLSQRSWVLLEIYNSVLVKQMDVRPLYIMLLVTSSGKSPLTHCSWWMQTTPSTHLTEGYVHRWLFVSATAIVCHLAYLYSEEPKFHHQTGRLREIHRLVLPVYAIGITPMLEMIKPESPKDITMKHVAFADDLGWAGELLELRRWCPTAALWEDEPRTTEGKWPTSIFSTLYLS